MSDPVHQLNDLPLLDSFIKESLRTNAFEIVSYRRIAMCDFTFSGGFTVAKGEWVVAPQQQMLNDPHHYPNPSEFDGFRFARNSGVASSKFTQSAAEWPFWGSQKQACPGRFYISLTSKIVLAHLLLEYDIGLPSTGKLPRAFKWRTSSVPDPGTVLCVRPKEKEEIS